MILTHEGARLQEVPPQRAVLLGGLGLAAELEVCGCWRFGHKRIFGALFTLR